MQSVIQSDVPLMDRQKLSSLLFESFYQHQEVMDILFSGNQASVQIHHLEQSFKEYIFQTNPRLRPHF